MPHFTLPISSQGALLTASVGVSKPRRDALVLANQPIPNFVQIQAMIDTGASCTCIDTSILTTLNLSPTGSTSIKTPSTGNQPFPVFQYDVALVIPPASAKHAPFFIGALAVIRCDDLHLAQGFHALIGRDVLAQCVLTYNGSDGTFFLAY